MDKMYENGVEREGYEKIADIGDFVQLKKSDFYPPKDDRLYTSGISDVEGGDTFDEYTRWFWDEYEDDIFDS